MQLVFDIGNSSTKGALFMGDRLDHTFRIANHSTSFASTVLAEIEDRRISRAGIASVVPSVSGELDLILHQRGIPVRRVHPSMELPFQLAYRTPETLGADRLAAAAAAWMLYGTDQGRSVVALDAGTAFTYEVVKRPGTYLGGTIAPGPALMQRALNRNTAQLPDVPLVMPESIIGRTTAESIQAGTMYGFIESVRGLLRRIGVAIDEPPLVVATGGWSVLLGEQLEEVDVVEPHLVLQGVRLLVELNE